MKHKIEVEVNVPDGFVMTDEFRRVKKGEYYLLPHGTGADCWNISEESESIYFILNRSTLSLKGEADHIATEAIRRAAMSLCRHKTAGEFTDGGYNMAERAQIVSYLADRYDSMCEAYNLDHASAPIEVKD